MIPAKKTLMTSEMSQIIIGIFILAVFFILTRIGIAWRIERACLRIVKELKNRQALDPSHAVELPYGKADLMKIGLRDFRPKALESLLHSGIVKKTTGGRYYLGEKNKEA